MHDVDSALIYKPCIASLPDANMPKCLMFYTRCTSPLIQLSKTQKQIIVNFNQGLIMFGSCSLCIKINDVCVDQSMLSRPYFLFLKKLGLSVSLMHVCCFGF